MLREMGHWKLETAKLRALQCMHAVKEVGVWNAVSGGVVGWGMVGGWCIYDSGWWLVVVGGGRVGGVFTVGVGETWPPFTTTATSELTNSLAVSE